jgi:two-component system sensor histidine kinase YesM
MVYSLGRLLRESVGRKGDFIRLCDEISFIHNYLSIHKMIYGGKIEVKYDLDDRLDDCLVPKFLLQPLVENAVKHGIEEKPGKGVIGITARAEGGTLLLEVSDNGIGIDPQQAERLLNPPGADKQEENRDAQNSKHTNVGLISVHKRIRLLYGDDYGLTIASEKHVGTVVTVRMPVITEEGADAIQSGSH